MMGGEWELDRVGGQSRRGNIAGAFTGTRNTNLPQPRKYQPVRAFLRNDCSRFHLSGDPKAPEIGVVRWPVDSRTRVRIEAAPPPGSTGEGE